MHFIKRWVRLCHSPNYMTIRKCHVQSTTWGIVIYAHVLSKGWDIIRTPRSPNPPLFPNESFSRQTTERVHTGSSETSAKSTSYCTRRNRQRGFIQHKRIRNCDSTIIRLRSSPCVGSFAKHYYVIYKQTCEHLAPVPALNAHKRRGLGSAADDNYYIHIHE